MLALAAGLLGASTLWPGAARAQITVDVTKITCGEFASGFLDDALLLSVWLSGYYHAKRDNTILDVTQVKMNAQSLTDLCRRQPTRPVMQAVEELMGPGKTGR
jgi:hypothetical protein